jgi:hypothetical protein
MDNWASQTRAVALASFSWARTPFDKTNKSVTIEQTIGKGCANVFTVIALMKFIPYAEGVR